MTKPTLMHICKNCNSNAGFYSVYDMIKMQTSSSNWTSSAIPVTSKKAMMPKKAMKLYSSPMYELTDSEEEESESESEESEEESEEEEEEDDYSD